MNDAKRGKQPKKSGKPRLSQELRDLVVRMGKENLLWGYRQDRRRTEEARPHRRPWRPVRRILARRAFTPRRRRTAPPAAHAVEPVHRVAHGFLGRVRLLSTKPVHTIRGKFDAYVLGCNPSGQPQGLLSKPATFTPDEKWVMQQARNAAMWMQDEGIKPVMFLMDRDTKFTLQFPVFLEEGWGAAKAVPVGRLTRTPTAKVFFPG